MYPPDIVEALKDALKAVYWYKRQLRSFMENCGVPAEIIQRQHWDDPQEYKVRIVDKVINALMASGEEGLGPIRALTWRLVQMKDFSHLLHEDNGRRLKAEAELYVSRLKMLVEQHDMRIREDEEKAIRHKIAAEERQAALSKRMIVDDLRQRFCALVSVSDHQQRGREFERFLFDLFNVFDLQPRGPFSIAGEQIDGAFEMDGFHFLLEAKWQNDLVGARDLRSFKEQIESKLDNTLGLFVSLNGFSSDGVHAVLRSRPNLILMDGEDLTAVLEGRTDLRQLLHRKIRHAAQTGEIYLRFRDM